MVRHVIWDWNGTLLDDVWLSVETVNHLLEQEGLETLSEERYAQLFGWPLRDYYAKLGFDFDAETFAEFCDRWFVYYRTKERQCGLRAGAREVLAELQGKGVTQSILSAYEHHALVELVEVHELGGHFDEVLGLHTDVDTGKVERGLRWFRESPLKPEDVLFVGDTDHDVEVAEALGVECVLVASGHQTPDRLRATGRRVVEDLGALADLWS